MNSPIPILFTIPNFITAGSGRALLNVLERLDRNQWSPSVCVLRKGGVDKEVERLGIPLMEAPFCVQVKPYITLPYRVWKAAGFFRKHGFRLWHSFHYLDDYTEPLIAKFSGARYWVYTKKNMSWGNRAWKLRSFLADRIAAQNTKMMDAFYSNCRQKSIYIAPGVDAQKYSPGLDKSQIRKQFNLPQEGVLAVHVANFVPVKNHSFLLKAFARIKKEVKLFLVGDFLDKEYTEEIRLLAKTLQIEDRVIFWGEEKNIQDFLKAMDLFVFSSHQEACPVAALEAMATALPSVVTDIPAMQDIHNQTALVTPCSDPQAFASAIDQLTMDSSKREQLGQAARDRVQNLFSLEQESEKYSRLYSELLCKS